MNTLGTPEGRETQVRRLLGAQPGRDRMVRVVREWLGVDRIMETAKDTTLYTEFTPAIRTSMDTETKKFIDEVVQRIHLLGTVGELMSANWSIVDTGLAGVYGATSAGATAHTSLPKRLGILNQAAFLSVFAHAQESAPALRGVAVSVPGRGHEASRSAVVEHRGRADRAGSARSRPRERHRHPGRPTPPATAATTPSIKSASRSSCSTAWASSARL